MCLIIIVVDFVIFLWIGNVIVVKIIVNGLVSNEIWIVK